MSKIMLIKLVPVLLLLALSGCGSAGGGTSEFKTSYVSATAVTGVLDSDVVNWVDATGAKAPACAASSFQTTPAADSIDFTVTSTAYKSTGSTGLPLRIESATITYTPANTATPAMATEYQTLGITLANDASVTVPVRVVSQEQKLRLTPVLACSSTIYNYHTTVSFSVTEIGTGTNKSVPASLQLRLADYIDK
jgi:zona occludens toxin (predicted ATPase)